MAPLTSLMEGEKVKIVKILLEKGEGLDSRGTLEERVRDMGLPVGQEVKILRTRNKGPILLRADNMRIALSNGMARAIMVEKLGTDLEKG